jgi:hypothetical protein
MTAIPVIPGTPLAMTGRIAAYLQASPGSSDARIFLLTTLVSGAAISLWTDFNLYLSALGSARRSASSPRPARLRGDRRLPGERLSDRPAGRPRRESCS